MKTADYKINMNQRMEVNRLLEEANGDLEALLTRLVCQRDNAIEHGLKFQKDAERMDWMADSYGAAGLDQPSAEAEARAFEQAFAAAKKRGAPDRIAVRAAVDVAILLNGEVRGPSL